MALVNYASREISVKIVYYGPGLSGKTTNIQHVHGTVNKENRGKLVSLSTQGDRTIFFDFLPVEMGSMNGFKTRFHLYTVPGQVFYNSTRKMVLKGADGVVFVADSQKTMMKDNVQSLENLRENLLEIGIKMDKFPVVLQYNKRDLPNAVPVEEMNAYLNQTGLPWFEATAAEGKGVLKTLASIVKYVLHNIERSPEVQTVDVRQADSRPSSEASGKAGMQDAPPPAADEPGREVSVEETLMSIDESPSEEAPAEPEKVKGRPMRMETPPISKKKPFRTITSSEKFKEALGLGSGPGPAMETSEVRDEEPATHTEKTPGREEAGDGDDYQAADGADIVNAEPQAGTGANKTFHLPVMLTTPDGIIEVVLRINLDLEVLGRVEAISRVEILQPFQRGLDPTTDEPGPVVRAEKDIPQDAMPATGRAEAAPAALPYDESRTRETADAGKPAADDGSDVAAEGSGGKPEPKPPDLVRDPATDAPGKKAPELPRPRIHSRKPGMFRRILGLW